MSEADRISGFCKNVTERGEERSIKRSRQTIVSKSTSYLPGYEVSLTTSGWAGSIRASETESSFIESSSATQEKGKERVRDH